MPWGLLAGIFLALPIVLLIRPSAVYDNFFQFLYWIGAGYAPIIGIVVADYFLLRRQRVDMRAVFDLRDGSPYAFWRGWNIAAYLAFGGGLAVYFSLLNPSTLWYSAPFPYLSATLPALLSAGAIYLLLTAVWVRRVGKGGYAA
jgi:NCS1 family nucleobase:cation symporter-1